jgi:hypothetical protein
MTRKLLKTVAIVVIALAPSIAAGSAEAHGGGFMGSFHGGGFGRGGFGDRGFRGDRFRFGGFFGGFYPGYYGSYYLGHYGCGPCYPTVYGTTIVTDHGTDAARESQNRNAALGTGVPAYWRGSWLNHARAALP